MSQTWRHFRFLMLLPDFHRRLCFRFHTEERTACKDTLRNVREVGEFVCHIVDETMADAMVRTAMDWPSGVSEIDVAGLTAVPSGDVQPLRVKRGFGGDGMQSDTNHPG